MVTEISEERRTDTTSQLRSHFMHFTQMKYVTGWAVFRKRIGVRCYATVLVTMVHSFTVENR
jgi:hypothetical protein